MTVFDFLEKYPYMNMVLGSIASFVGISAVVVALECCNSSSHEKDYDNYITAVSPSAKCIEMLLEDRIIEQRDLEEDNGFNEDLQKTLNGINGTIVRHFKGGNGYEAFDLEISRKRYIDDQIKQSIWPELNSDINRRSSHDYWKFVDSEMPEISMILEKLNVPAKIEPRHKVRYAQRIANFVQSLRYQKNADFSYGPREALVDTSNCVGHSVLAASLLVKAEYNVALIGIPGHLYVGVELEDRFAPRKGWYVEDVSKPGLRTKFYELEVTGNGWPVGRCVLNSAGRRGELRDCREESVILYLNSKSGGSGIETKRKRR